MGGFSVFHWLIVLLIFAPFFQIVRKAGFSPFWGILAFVPLVNIIALWVFAFIRWPRDENVHGVFE
jgi:predicted ABC-type exoprotein transport system permease subunit